MPAAETPVAYLARKRLKVIYAIMRDAVPYAA